MLKHGAAIVAVAASITSYYFNTIWRKNFNLRSRAIYLTFLPTIVIPSFSTAALFFSSVHTPLMLKQLNCSVCAELRAVSIQVSVGVALPLALGALSSAAAAKTVHSYPVPSILASPGQVLAMYRGFFTKMKTGITLALILNILLSMEVAYFVEKKAILLNSKLNETGLGQTYPKEDKEDKEVSWQ